MLVFLLKRMFIAQQCGADCSILHSAQHLKIQPMDLKNRKKKSANQNFCQIFVISKKTIP
jgi:hypothetical protein